MRDPVGALQAQPSHPSPSSVPAWEQRVLLEQGMLLSPRPVPAPEGPTICTQRRASFPKTPPHAQDAEQHLSLPAVPVALGSKAFARCLG